MSRIVTNLPFGKQLGSAEDNATLYPALADEFSRVLSADGLLVTLTSDDQRWTQTLQQHGWHITKRVVLVVLGQPATIFVADKQSGTSTSQQ
jgi:23S rRNA G2445 N2-methylase RlmL